MQGELGMLRWTVGCKSWDIEETRRLKYTFESHCGLDIVTGVHSVQNYRRNMVEARRTEHIQSIREGAGES